MSQPNRRLASDPIGNLSTEEAILRAEELLGLAEVEIERRDVDWTSRCIRINGLSMFSAAYTAVAQANIQARTAPRH